MFISSCFYLLKADARGVNVKPQGPDSVLCRREATVCRAEQEVCLLFLPFESQASSSDPESVPMTLHSDRREFILVRAL